MESEDISVKKKKRKKEINKTGVLKQVHVITCSISRGLFMCIRKPNPITFLYMQEKLCRANGCRSDKGTRMKSSSNTRLPCMFFEIKQVFLPLEQTVSKKRSETATFLISFEAQCIQ